MTSTMRNEVSPEQPEETATDLLFDVERSALADLLRFFEQRRRCELELVQRFTKAEDAAVQQHNKEREDLLDLHAQNLADIDGRYSDDEHSLQSRSEADKEAQEALYVESRAKLDKEEKETSARIKGELTDALWTADSVFEAGQRRIQESRETIDRKVATIDEHGEALWKAVLPLLGRVDLERDELEPKRAVPAVEAESLRDLQTLQTRAENVAAQIQRVPLLRWITLSAQFSITLGYCILACVPALFLHPWYLWLGGGAVVGFGLALIGRMILVGLAQRRLSRLGRGLAVLLQQGAK